MDPQKDNSTSSNRLHTSTEVMSEPKPFALSSGAAPFIPSFMRCADQQQQPQACAPSSTPAMPVDSGLETQQQPKRMARRKKKTKGTAVSGNASSLGGGNWVSLLQEMSLDELEALMRCMPQEVQQFYLQQTGRAAPQHKRGGRGRGGGGRGVVSATSTLSAPVAFAAAMTTLSQLPPQQLAVLEELLWEMETEDAVAAGLLNEDEAGLYMDDDAGLQSDEEEWLMEQLMGADAGKVADQDEAAEGEQ